MLLGIAVVNLFTKPAATISGVIFSGLLFLAFELSEKRIQQASAAQAHVELDQFNLAQAGDLTPRIVGVQPGNILVPVSTYYALYHLEAALRRAKKREAEIVVLHVRMLRRAASGEYDLAPDQLFSTIEQLLFTKVLSIAEKEGKPVRLAVVAGKRSVGRHPAHGRQPAVQHDRAGQLRENADHRAGARNRHRVGTHAGAASARHAGNIHAVGAGAGFLSRAARAAADAERNRSAAQDLAAIERQAAGRGNSPPRHRPLRAGRSRARELENGKEKEVLDRLRNHLTDIHDRRLTP